MFYNHHLYDFNANNKNWKYGELPTHYLYAVEKFPPPLVIGLGDNRQEWNTNEPVHIYQPLTIFGRIFFNKSFHRTRGNNTYRALIFRGKHNRTKLENNQVYTYEVKVFYEENLLIQNFLCCVDWNSVQRHISQLPHTWKWI